MKHRLNFLALFFPPEAPTALAFLLVPIEIVSFFSRPFSLAIRLFANMTAGHVLLKILAGFFLIFLSSLFGFVFKFDLFNRLLGSNLLDLSNSVFFAFGDLSYCTFMSQNIFYITSVFSIFELSLVDAMLFAPFNVSNIMKMYGIQFTNLTQLPVIYDLLVSVKYPYPEIFASYLRLFGISDMMQIYLELPFKFNPLIENSVSSGVVMNLSFIIVFFTSLVHLVFLSISVAVPVIVLFVFFILEFFVAVLQAYVFSILVVIYIRDVIDLH
jgi:hypothetical protein